MNSISIEELYFEIASLFLYTVLQTGEPLPISTSKRLFLYQVLWLIVTI